MEIAHENEMYKTIWLKLFPSLDNGEEERSFFVRNLAAKWRINRVVL